MTEYLFFDVVGHSRKRVPFYAERHRIRYGAFRLLYLCKYGAGMVQFLSMPRF